MFEPPVSTPTARMMATAASRSSWYASSDSVIWGATVTESPVCTPMGSRFSIEHTMTTLSLRSRITSSSNSSQPLDGVLDEHLADRALTQPSLHLRPELLGRVRKASTVAAECEGRTHHRRNRDPAEVVDAR